MSIISGAMTHRHFYEEPQRGYISQFGHGFVIGARRLFTVQMPLLFLFHLMTTLIDKISKRSVTVLTKTAMHSFTSTVIVAPIVEEVAFRGILQPAIKTICRPIVYCLSPSRISYEKRKEICYNISRVVSSVLFGAAHLMNASFMGLQGAIIQSILAGISGFAILSPLKERYGLSASIGAHAGNNFCAVALSKILK